MSTYDPITRAELAEILTHQQPFGPPDAAQFTSNTEVLRLLYDAANRTHRQATVSAAPYVIGRKGAGKTAFVMAPKLLPNSCAVELPSADVYQGVFSVIGMLRDRRLAVYPEHSARLWRHLTWCAVLAEVARSTTAVSASSTTVKEFATALGEGEIPVTADVAVSKYLRRVVAQIESSRHVGGVGDLLNGVSCNGYPIDRAIEAGTELIQQDTKRYVVIVDSLERYRGILPTSQYDEVESSSFEGLFRFIGSAGTEKRRAFDIRFAFPAELWSILENVSSNPIKDFSQRVIAHWSARELISLVGTRLALYCDLHVPERRVGRSPLDGDPEPLAYEDARRAMLSLFPSDIKNGFAGREDLFAYLLRHTQLLPRHLITILNRVFEAQHGIDPSAPVMSNAAVVEGVRRGETEVVSDVLAAYLQVHPMARICCERLIPNLGMTFTEGELHRAYNRGGVRDATRLEFRDVIRCLVEIGCIGRVTEEDATGRYVIAEFEYTRPGSLYIGSEEMLCLHPVFAEVFNCTQSTLRRRQMSAEERAAVRPVYPIGCDPTSTVDYRDVI